MRLYYEVSPETEAELCSLGGSDTFIPVIYSSRHFNIHVNSFCILPSEWLKKQIDRYVKISSAPSFHRNPNECDMEFELYNSSHGWLENVTERKDLSEFCVRTQNWSWLCFSVQRGGAGPVPRHQAAALREHNLRLPAHMEVMMMIVTVIIYR